MVFSPRPASRSRLTMAYSARKMLVKPRLGRRRCSGIWPPSKPRIMREPERERWPLWPRVEVLPMPLPMPRPTRLRFSDDFLGARIVERFIAKFLHAAANKPRRENLGDDPDQMRDLVDHAANRGRIFALDDLVEPGESQALHYFFMLHRRGNGRAHPLDAYLAGGF